jgi:hypothetical protein
MSTNILIINFDASTLQGIFKKDQRYKPSMSNPSLYSSFPNILFIPTIRLRKGLFAKDLGDDDIKKIFLSPVQFDNFISRLREKKLYKPLKISEAKEKGIIYNNIKFILDLFFKKNDKITLDTQSFVINNYQWNNKYTLTPVAEKKAPIVNVSISLILHKGNESLTFTESTRLNCMQKKESIISEYKELVGLDNLSKKTASSSSIPQDKPDSPPSSKNNKPKKVTERTYYYGGKYKRKSKKNKKI